MSNIIQFKPKAVEPEIVPADDKLYSIRDLEFAVGYAAFVEHDLQAVDLLSEQIRLCLRSAVAVTYLPSNVRTHCANYLRGGEDKNQMTKDYFEAIYRPLSPPSQR